MVLLDHPIYHSSLGPLNNTSTPLSRLPIAKLSSPRPLLVPRDAQTLRDNGGRGTTANEEVFKRIPGTPPCPLQSFGRQVVELKDTMFHSTQEDERREFFLF